MPEELNNAKGFENRYSGLLHEYNAQIMDVRCLPHYEEIRTRASELIARDYQPNHRTLEIGAGQGDSAKPILDMSKTIHLDLLDVADAMIRDAKLRLAEYSDRLRFIAKDAFTYLSTKRAPKYTKIFAQFTVHNFKRGDKQKLFKAIHANLKPGGTFILLDKIYPDDALLSEKLLGEQCVRYRSVLPELIKDQQTATEVIKEIIAHEKSDYYDLSLRTTEREIIQMLADAGFSKVGVHTRIDRDAIIVARK